MFNVGVQFHLKISLMEALPHPGLMRGNQSSGEGDFF